MNKLAMLCGALILLGGVAGCGAGSHGAPTAHVNAQVSNAEALRRCIAAWNAAPAGADQRALAEAHLLVNEPDALVGLLAEGRCLVALPYGQGESGAPPVFIQDGEHYETLVVAHVETSSNASAYAAGEALEQLQALAATLAQEAARSPNAVVTRGGDLEATRASLRTFSVGHRLTFGDEGTSRSERGANADDSTQSTSTGSTPPPPPPLATPCYGSIAVDGEYRAGPAPAIGPIQALAAIGTSCARVVEVAKAWTEEHYSADPTGTTSVDGFSCTRMYGEPVPVIACVTGKTTVSFGIYSMWNAPSPSPATVQREIKEGRKEYCTREDEKFGECKVGEVVPKNRQ
jgi:hypothetical protein